MLMLFCVPLFGVEGAMVTKSDGDVVIDVEFAAKVAECGDPGSRVVCLGGCGFGSGKK